MGIAASWRGWAGRHVVQYVRTDSSRAQNRAGVGGDTCRAKEKKKKKRTDTDTTPRPDHVSPGSPSPRIRREVKRSPRFHTHPIPPSLSLPPFTVVCTVSPRSRGLAGVGVIPPCCPPPRTVIMNPVRGTRYASSHEHTSGGFQQDQAAAFGPATPYHPPSTPKNTRHDDDAAR